MVTNKVLHVSHEAFTPDGDISEVCLARNIAFNYVVNHVNLPV